jgi:hypothetical protein
MPTVAAYPFDMSAADVTIRTSDNVDFRLFKTVLILASSFFSDMFSLTQPPNHAIDETVDPIFVSESSETFDCLMRFCYPIDDPVLSSLSLTEKVLEAAMKYEMAEAIKLSKTILRGFVSSNPLDVYAISCRLCLESEARLAAQSWKSSSNTSPRGSFEFTLAGRSFSATIRMRDITAGAYYRLLRYVRDDSGTHTMLTIPSNPKQKASQDPVSTAAKARCLHDTSVSDMVLLSQDGVEFPVLSPVLFRASAGKLLNPESPRIPSSNLTESTSTKPIIHTNLPSTTLAELLRLCYPLETFDISNLSLLCDVYAAAKQLNITKMTSTIQKNFRSLIDNNESTVSLYFIATERGWKQEARDAAAAIAKNGLQDQYAAEMEDVSSVQYYNLLRFCYEYAAAVELALREHAPHFTRKNESRENLPVQLVALPIAASIIAQNRASSGYYSSYPRDEDVETLLRLSQQFDDKLSETLSRVSSFDVC